MPRALITGIGGQDGAYLAEYLLNSGYSVVGTYRRSTHSLLNLDRLDIYNPNLTLVESDVSDPASCMYVITKYEPDEVYNLAAQSHVGNSFKNPMACMVTTGMGAVNLLEAIRKVNSQIKFYQASTSELFGNATESPQTILTPLKPRSPYGCAKLYAHQMTINYREYGIHTVCGILFNHESPLRGSDFVTQKVVKGLIGVQRGDIPKVVLGNLDARRDWGHARDYVWGMVKMLHSEPGEYILATGETRSVRELVETVHSKLGITKPVNDCVYIDPDLYRPAEIHELKGQANVPGWSPQITFEQLIEEMINAERRR